jgi:hypothetical protein
MPQPFRLAVIAFVLAGLTTAALAQPAPTTRIRGTIAAIDGPVMTVATREGPKLPITLTEPVSVITVKSLDLAAIQPGAYVGAAAETAANGQLNALEVLVLPEAARGSGEGHREWDLKPGSTMTNATVAAATNTGSGVDVDLAYKDGSKKIHVPPGTPIVTVAPAERADLKPGAPVFLTATKNPDGSLSAARVVVGKDGVAPPM